ncbi:MAG: L,D-transpeptidase family protein [Campylobacterales bacterium]|nr:L,D-transpeptidase family protein [Campylobacterales bacterium]
MKAKFVIAILFFIFTVFTLAGNMNKQHTQMIMVTSNDYSSPYAKLQRYIYENGKWQQIGEQIDVKIGKNGMGWGIGLHKTPTDAVIIKKEGDGKSPIGIFELKEAFGYEQLNAAYPYMVMSEKNHCIDDINSKWYNKVIDSTKVVKDYSSHEVMKFKANYYRYGIVVDHNPNGAKGAGSCIFMHIKDIPTTGCTAMSESQMVEIIKWLDPRAKPILLQAPKSETKGLMEQLRNL